MSFDSFNERNEQIDSEKDSFILMNEFDSWMTLGVSKLSANVFF